MAVVTRYFSTAAAGAGDGTTWADRAQLHNAGTWSTVISANDFGTDSLYCLIGPGNHTITAVLQSSVFSVAAPTALRPLYFVGCNSSGVELAPPDPDWVSAMDEWDESSLPSLNTTTNIGTINLSHCHVRLVAFTASGATSSNILTTQTVDWIACTNSTANTGANSWSSTSANVSVRNSWFKHTGSSYTSLVRYRASNIENTRVIGNSSASSGNRDGFVFIGTSDAMQLHGCTSISNPGHGVTSTSTNVAQSYKLVRCTIANNSGDGVRSNSTASQTTSHHIADCCITGNGGYGINPQSQGIFNIWNTRLRDNTSGNIGTGPGSLAVSGLGIYTTDSDDATEYVDSGAGDYRIANTAATWGLGYGAGDEEASGGGGSALHLGGLGQTGIGAF